jgi:hypothetical protein
MIFLIRVAAFFPAIIKNYLLGFTEVFFTDYVTVLFGVGLITTSFSLTLVLQSKNIY